jgi:DNA (cytosine-5)-methyltransferase 1
MIIPGGYNMKKQFHLRLDEEIATYVKSKAQEQGVTIQDYIQSALLSFTQNKKVSFKDAPFTFIDLFAGIGGMRIAFESCGGKCVFSSEYNKYSQETYFANFAEMPEGDITLLNEKDIPNHDILVAGFPCQPFSIAGVSKKISLGKAHGFLDKTQGTLFFDVARIIEEKRPRAFLLENVKNLKTHDKGNTFKVITETLEALNYTIFYKVMDGKNYVPQHRERIFIVGFSNDHYSKNINFQFPDTTLLKQKSIKDILAPSVDSKYTLSDKLWNYLVNYAEKHRQKGNGFGFGLVDLNGIARTLSARYHKDGSEILIPQENSNPRRLTPRECARIQGFPDSFKIVVSDTQAYRQFGNSVVVPLVTAIAGEMVNAMCLEAKTIIPEVECEKYNLTATM